MSKDPFRPVSLQVRQTDYAGRGVFALEPIPSGAVIEECPLLLVSAEHLQVMVKTSLDDYFFQWGAARDEGALALGYGSLYNHSFSPNALYVRKPESQTLMFVALRDIAEGEEVTVNYNGSPEDQSPVWF